MLHYFIDLFSNKKYFFVFSIIFILGSCIDKMDSFELEQEPYLVVNCLFTPDSLFTVYVFSNSNILDTNLRVVENATVEIWIENNLLETLPYNTNGFYKAENLKPSVDIEYILKVKADGYPSIKATDKIPDNSVEIINANCYVDVYMSGMFIPPREDIRDSKIEFTFKENNSSLNYYQVANFSENYDYNDSLFESNIFFSTTNNPTLLQYIDAPQFCTTCFTNELSNDTISFDIRLYTTTLMYPYPNRNDFFIDLRIISQTYFNYKIDLMNYIYYQSNIDIANIDGNLFFDTEIKEVFSNIETGYGIFAGYSSQIIDLTEL